MAGPPFRASAVTPRATRSGNHSSVTAGNRHLNTADVPSGKVRSGSTVMHHHGVLTLFSHAGFVREWLSAWSGSGGWRQGTARARQALTSRLFVVSLGVDKGDEEWVDCEA